MKNKALKILTIIILMFVSLILAEGKVNAELYTSLRGVLDYESDFFNYDYSINTHNDYVDYVRKEKDIWCLKSSAVNELKDYNLCLAFRIEIGNGDPFKYTMYSKYNRTVAGEMDLKEIEKKYIAEAAFLMAIGHKIDEDGGPVAKKYIYNTFSEKIKNDNEATLFKRFEDERAATETERELTIGEKKITIGQYSENLYAINNIFKYDNQYSNPEIITGEINYNGNTYCNAIIPQNADATINLFSNNKLVANRIMEINDTSYTLKNESGNLYNIKKGNTIVGIVLQNRKNLIKR